LRKIEPQQSSWRERWSAARDRLLADQRFQRWAATFPITRQIAQRRSRAFFDLCAGFVYSQVLAACVRLRLFDMLLERPRTAAQLSRELALPMESTTWLLEAAASLKLLERRGSDRFGLAPMGAVLAGNPATVALIEQHSRLYADLLDPVALLREGRHDTAVARYWAYARAEQPEGLSAAQVADYTALMSASQALLADAVVDAYSLDGHRVLLDVGGGDGTFLIKAASRAPHLRLVLFDLPALAERARVRLAEAGLGARAEVVAGNFHAGQLPAGADIVTLLRVVHDQDDDAALALLRSVRRALPEDGVLLIAEPMAGTPGTERLFKAYLGSIFLAAGTGRARTPDEIGSLLRNAGFARSRLIACRRDLFMSVVVAHCNPHKSARAFTRIGRGALARSKTDSG
jgi:demethylspheroidene O-methyltransferase